MDKRIKYIVPIFAMMVAVFGVIRVSIWAELTTENVLFVVIALISVFLSGMLSAVYYMQDKKQKD